MSDNVTVLKEALTQAYDRGYVNGTVNAMKALSSSLHFVNNCGVLTPEEKKGYKIALDTVDATLKILEEGKEKDAP